MNHIFFPSMHENDAISPLCCWCSDEDIDVGALLKSWLMSQPEECYANLENWLGDYFQRALGWVLKQVGWIFKQV